MSRLFRVFVSSSFLDMAQERRALAAGVFEPLGELCAARGASFQAVDLRWAISPHAVLEQRTMPVCLAEVRRCVQMSPRLNFLALVGDRRGWLPVPTTIPAAEFALFAADLTTTERGLLDRWYRIDDNAVPSALRLRPRRDVDDAGWARVEERLREVLERVVLRVPQHRRLAYVGSAVEQEVAAGVLSVADAGGAFAVVRERGPRNDADGTHLDWLEAALRERLPQDQVLTLRPDDSEEGLVAAVRSRFTELIESALDDEPSNADPGATTAVHRRQAGRLLAADAPDPTAKLVGRHVMFADLVRFARAPGQGLLGVVGSAGIGKTALVGAVAAEPAGRDGAVVILRLLGTTAATTRLDGPLRGLVEEIGAGLEATVSPAPDVPELIRQFAGLLARARADRPFLLFLDAIDQLAPDHAAHRLGWLPDPVPPHVRVVVSTLPGPTQNAIRARTDSAMRHLDGLSVEEGRQLLRRWLAAAERMLTAAQERAVLAAFATQGRPLWLRMAFEQARYWPSDAPPTTLPHDLSDLVRVLFDRLADDAAHGPTLVRHVLALLAASGFGLTELDVLATLSDDPHVMAEVRARAHERWRPELTTFPVVLWAQLRADLAPFLTERDADGEVLHDFYHRVLRDVATGEGLRPPHGAARHRQLAALFTRAADPDSTRSWRGATPRAFDRLPTHLQAGEAWTALAHTLVDFRFLQAKATLVGRVSSIDARGRHIVRHSGVHAVQTDLTDLLAAAPHELAPDERAACIAVAQALGLEADLLTAQPALLWQQLANRLRWDCPPVVTALLDREEARRTAEGAPAWLRLHRPVRQTPGLRHVLRERGRARCCALSPDGALLVSGGDEDATLWDAVTGAWLADLPGHRGPVHACAVASDAIFTGDDAGILRRWSWDGVRAAPVRARQVGPQQVRACAVAAGHVLVAGPDGLRQCDRNTLEVVALLDESPLAACCALDEQGELAVAGYLDGSVRAWQRGVPVARREDTHRRSVNGCAVAGAGGTVLTAGQDGILRRWDSALRPLAEPLVDHDLPLATGVWACAGSRTLDRAVTALVGGAVQAWDTAAATVTTLAGHAGHVNAVATSNDGDIIASAGFDGTVRLWKPTAAAATAVEPFSTMIQTLALSTDGHRILTIDAYGVVRVGNTTAPAAEEVFTSCQSWCRDGAATADLATVVVIDQAGTVEVWNLSDRPGRRHILDHPDAAACLVVDDRIAVTAGDDGTCYGWDIGRGVRIWAAEMSRGVPVLATDGTVLLVAAGSGPVRLLDPTTGRGITLRDDGAIVCSAAFGPNGLVAVGTDTGQVLRWRTRDAVAEPPTDAHTGRVLHIAPGTARFPFLSTASNGELALWPAPPRASARRWTGHTGPVRGAAVDPHTDHVISAGDDKTLRVWTLSGTQQAELPLSGNGQIVAVQHGLIACGDDGGFIYLGALCDPA